MQKEQKIKILCVEDEQDIRINIAEILRDEGFEVFEAENGKLGFESFVKNKPDLVISDIMMPELDGYGLLRLIRESKNIRNNTTPFIFLSALGQKDDVIKGVNSLANDYLIKPIDFDLMIAKIREKTSNLLKIKEIHDRNIKNIKNQVSSILPSEVFSNLDIIGQISSSLKEQPYGPFPHRRYLEDIDKIYTASMKLRGSIANALDGSAIDHKLNAHEEVFNVNLLLNDFVKNLGEKFKNRVQIEAPHENIAVPLLKIDYLVFFEALRKIFVGMFKCDPEALVEINVIIDHLEQMAIIFYFKSKNQNIDIRSNLDASQVSKILDKQNCFFEVAENKKNTSILLIPSYRLIKQ